MRKNARISIENYSREIAKRGKLMQLGNAAEPDAWRLATPLSRSSCAVSSLFFSPFFFFIPLFPIFYKSQEREERCISLFKLVIIDARKEGQVSNVAVW